MNTEAGAVVPPQRRHELAGVYNLRDTGGYRAARGSSRWGKLFRSDAPHRVDEAGRAHLTSLGITQVVDLRGPQERLTALSLLDGLGMRIHNLPVFDESAPATQLRERARLELVYDLMVDERGPRLAEAIGVIADASDDEAVPVHYTAGKDRTGVVVALALSAAGVDRDDVVADYAQTADNLRGDWAKGMLASVEGSARGLTPELIELVTASPAAVMDALLARLDRQYGSVRDYLSAQGLATSRIDRLATTLIA